jgi:hypothetical protein
MTNRRRRASRPRVVAAWTLIWFGTILAINPDQSLSQFGAVLWIAGVLIQLFLVVRWLIGRPSSGAPVLETRPRRVPARV